MPFLSCSAPVTVVFMAGGASSRVGGLDKSMVPFAGSPLLAYMVAHALRAPCVREIIIAAGHRHGIAHYFANWHPLVRVVLSDRLCGTGGDLIRAVRQSGVMSEHTLALNADTVLSLDLEAMLDAHLRVNAEATVALTSAAGLGVQNVGAFCVDAKGRVLASFEAERVIVPDRSLTCSRASSTGAILYRTSVLVAADAPCGMSAERHLVPSLISRGSVAAFNNGLRPMFDNGTPERLVRLHTLGAPFLYTIYGPPLQRKAGQWL